MKLTSLIVFVVTLPDGSEVKGEFKKGYFSKKVLGDW